MNSIYYFCLSGVHSSEPILRRGSQVPLGPEIMARNCVYSIMLCDSEIQSGMVPVEAWSSDQGPGPGYPVKKK